VHSCCDVTGGRLEIWCIGPQCDLGNWISMRLLLRNASSAPAAHIPGPSVEIPVKVYSWHKARA
jgi:hypothetical protein